MNSALTNLIKRADHENLKDTFKISHTIKGRSYTYRDGRIYRDDDDSFAVLYSPDYGAGWSTWCEEEIQYCPIIVILLLRGVEIDQDTAEWIVKKWYGITHFYGGGVRSMKIQWVDEPYRILEFDGSETVEVFSEAEWDM